MTHLHIAVPTKTRFYASRIHVLKTETKDSLFGRWLTPLLPLNPQRKIQSSQYSKGKNCKQYLPICIEILAYTIWHYHPHPYPPRKGVHTCCFRLSVYLCWRPASLAYQNRKTVKINQWLQKGLGKCRHKKQSLFPTESPSERRYASSF